MPSFVIHSIVGNELLKKLDLKKEDRIKFFIGNLLPDSKNLNIENKTNSKEERDKVQSGKKITHFRSGEGVLEYPDVDLFLSKYKTLTENNIIALAYCFHLYTDYCYFKYFLPKCVDFLNKDGKHAVNREDEAYVYIKKSNKKIDKEVFWSKVDKNGLYQEYSRMNSYLVKKYKLDIDCNVLRDFLNKNNFTVEIEEISCDGVHFLIDKLDKILSNLEDCNEEEFTVFSASQLEEFIEKVLDGFIKEYGYLIDKYISDNK